MVEIYPLAPGPAWWRAYMNQKIQGCNNSDSVRFANETLLSFKEFGRMILRESNEETIILSVPVEGGNRQLRKTEILGSLALSDHGNWKKMHIGAIEACLGRKPFFRDLEPALSQVYNNQSLVTLAEFNAAIFEVLNTFLMGNIKPSQLKEFSKNPVIIERGKEIAEELDKDVSMLQNIALHGRDCLLGLLV